MPKTSGAKSQRSQSKPKKEPSQRSPKPLTASEEAEITAFLKRRNAHPPAAKILVKSQGKDVAIDFPQEMEPKLFQARLYNSFGLTDDNLAARLVEEIARLAQAKASEPAHEGTVNAALAIVHGVAPKDEIEALLAVQMAGTHQVAMDMLRRASQTTNADTLPLYGNLATKLLRTYTAQMEALNRHRGKGQQKVRVEHVHVYPGGQAIVGNVEGAGGQNKTEDQPHAPRQALAYAPGTPMPCLDAQRDSVPVPSDPGESSMPNAWRE